jgi:adenylate kinase
MIIALSGTPGTGKHTLAERLAKIKGYSIIDLGKALAGGKTEKDVTIDEINTAFQRMKKDNSIVVSHLSHFIRSKSIKLIIILRTDPVILIKRLEKRGYSKSKIYDNAMFEAIDGTTVEATISGKKTVQIDNSKNLNKTVKKTLDVINGKGRSDRVDFSSKITTVEKMFK